MSRPRLILCHIDEAGCWICDTPKPASDGYPTVWVDGRAQHLHRVLYERAYGPLGALQARHTCDVPLCINFPEHVIPGTIYENAQDRNERGRNNPPYGERSGTAKLSEKDVTDIEACKDVQRVIADRYGINQSQVSRIKSGKRWGWRNGTVNE